MYLGKIVEQGTTHQVFEQPRHPYTQALLHDVPSTDPEQRMLDNVVLEADATSVPWSGQGCRFSPRCPAVHVAECAECEPLLLDAGDGQMVACHMVNLL
jgi:oligopeptide transport system ATP-binding protein